jgi:flagellar basal body-associated protein FliL
MKKIIIIVVILAAVGAGAYFLFFKDQGEETKTELYNYAIKDAFITNVKDSVKLCKTQVVLVVNEKGLEDTLDENLYTIRDTVLFILRDLTEEDIKSMDIQEKLRESIPQALNQALEVDYVVSVYFSDFVMQ